MFVPRNILRTKYILYVCSTAKDKSSTLLYFIVDLYVVTTGLRAVKFNNSERKFLFNYFKTFSNTYLLTYLLTYSMEQVPS